jgi:hypothetical protein
MHSDHQYVPCAHVCLPSKLTENVNLFHEISVNIEIIFVEAQIRWLEDIDVQRHFAE